MGLAAFNRMRKQEEKKKIELEEVKSKTEKKVIKKGGR